MTKNIEQISSILIHIAKQINIILILIKTIFWLIISIQLLRFVGECYYPLNMRIFP